MWLPTFTLAFLVRVLLMAAGQTPSSASRIAELSSQWVDPITVAPPGTAYRLFDTNSRGKGTQGSYLIYLPRPTRHRIPAVIRLFIGFTAVSATPGKAHGRWSRWTRV